MSGQDDSPFDRFINGFINRFLFRFGIVAIVIVVAMVYFGIRSLWKWATHQ